MKMDAIAQTHRDMVNDDAGNHPPPDQEFGISETTVAPAWKNKFFDVWDAQCHLKGPRFSLSAGMVFREEIYPPRPLHVGVRSSLKKLCMHLREQ